MKRRTAFTLVELVVVVVIIGILAAIAAPKFMNISADARDNAARQSLSGVRDAIENFAAQNDGKYPGDGTTDETTVRNEIAKYLRGPFPTCPVDDNGRDQQKIEVTDAGLSLTDAGDSDPSTTGMWKYDTSTGEMIINFNGTDTNGLRYDNY